MEELGKLTINDATEALPEIIKILTPHSAEGFYARNNQFQISGPKGFTELKQGEDKDSFFARVDLPGSHVASIKFSRKVEDKSTMVFEVEAPNVAVYDHPETVARKYSGSISLPCECFEVSSHKTAGVLRLLFKKPTDSENPCSHRSVGSPSFGKQSTATVTGDTVGAGRETEEHPFVTEGSKKAFEALPTKEGGLYVRIDMPGVEEIFRFSVENHEVKFQGQGKLYKYENAGSRCFDDESDLNLLRRYVGSVSLFPPTSKIQGEVLHDMKNGVLRIVIPPQSA